MTRLLKLGDTLKKTPEGGFELDLSAPGCHKTAAYFGPSRSTVSGSAAKQISKLLANSGGWTDGAFLFHMPSKRTQVLSSQAWSERVKACFLRHSDVAFSPKDLRASFSESPQANMPLAPNLHIARVAHSFAE